MLLTEVHCILEKFGWSLADAKCAFQESGTAYILRQRDTEPHLWSWVSKALHFCLLVKYSRSVPKSLASEVNIPCYFLFFFTLFYTQTWFTKHYALTAVCLLIPSWRALSRTLARILVWKFNWSEGYLRVKFYRPEGHARILVWKFYWSEGYACILV